MRDRRSRPAAPRHTRRHMPEGHLAPRVRSIRAGAQAKWSLQGAAPFRVMAVAAKTPGGDELAQLVAHHRLRDEDRYMLASVVNGQRMTDELGKDRGAPRPRLDHALLA